jgi:hypothetical protein
VKKLGVCLLHLNFNVFAFEKRKYKLHLLTKYEHNFFHEQLTTT